MEKYHIDEKKALLKYADLCSKGEHCEFDIREKMSRTDLDDEAKDRIIAYLKKEKFLDEHRYVEAFVRDKVKFNGWGPQKVRFELMRRLISSSVINEVVSEIAESDMEEKLTRALVAKMKQTKCDDKMKLRASLMRLGASRGFSFDFVSRIVGKILND